MYVCVFYCLCKSKLSLSWKPMHLQVFTETLKPCICRVTGLLTRAFARLDMNRCKFQFEFCVNFFEFWVNFDCKMFEMKTKHWNCIAKTKRSLGSTKTRK